MPGNDFEKQVQQKMHELNFVPSDAVWPAVEKQIARRKKRRIIFLWFPLFVLLLGGAWYYNTKLGAHKSNQTFVADTKAYDSNSTDKNVPEKSTGIVQQSRQENIISNDSITNSASGEKIKEPSTIAAATGVKSKQPVDNIQAQKETGGANVGVAATALAHTKRNNKSEPKPGTKNLNGNVAKATADFSAVQKNKKSKTATGSPVTTEAVAAEENTEADITTANKTAPVKNEDAKPVVVLPHADTVTAADALAKTEAVNKADTVKKAIAADSAVAKNKHAAKKKKNIEWGVEANAGVSNITDGFISFPKLFSSGLAYADNSALSSAPGNGQNNGNNNASGSAKPSNIKPGFAFAAGVFVRKPLGKGYSIKTGIRYSYSSTRIETGTRIDTGSNIARLQYRTGTSKNYTNQFHFIELPLTMEKQLGKKSRFTINGGFSVSIFAGSNALFYDAPKNLYVADNSYINKTQFNFLAGFNYQLFRGPHPVEIGPQFSYGMGNIFKKELFGNRHLFFAGINARVYLHKK